MGSFEVTVASNRIALSASAGGAYTGQTTFTVKNLLDHRVKVRGSASTSDPSKAEWFAVDGDRTLETSASVTFTVKMTIPAGTTAIEYSFRPVAASVDDPSNESEVGPPVVVTLAQRARSLAWIWAVAGGVVALAGVTVLIVVLLHKPAGATKKPDGEACTENAECVSGHCKGGKCGAGTEGGCTSDADCPADKNRCIRSACQAPVPNGRDCKEDHECGSDNCFHAACSPAGTCLTDGDCKAPNTCNKNLCGLKEADDNCSANAQCATGRCVHDRCSDPLQCSNDGDCSGKICLLDWCRAPSLRDMQQVSPGSGSRVAKLGDTVDVKAHFHAAGVVTLDRDELATVVLGRTEPPTLTDVLLGLAPNGDRRFVRLPSPPPWKVNPATSPFFGSISAEFQLVRIK